MNRSLLYDVVAGKTSIASIEAFLKQLGAVAQSTNTSIQAVDATKIAGREHVDYAVDNAIRSFAEHRNIAGDLGVEILLQLSACRQIRKALEMGVHAGEMDVLLIIIGTKKSVERALKKLTGLIDVDPRVIDYNLTKNAPLMRAFDITEREIAAAGGYTRIPDLVHERLALFYAFR
ncbi:MAG TPA: KEOPS complex subunit Cgi121 [Candidatus Bathyarchaeia archaeon]|nr:KEOPS complex subunit Cgi121 [Candidatus Bathyarchaeia archaeon]